MLANQQLPGKNKGWSFTLDKGHLAVGAFFALIAGAFVLLGLLAWSKDRMLANVNCSEGQIKMSEFSGAGMSVTCMPLKTYTKEIKKRRKKKSI